jgi:DNA repair exonuclease SbcCD ATPase subunit
MNDSGVVSVDTMAELIEKGLATEAAFIKTANGYKISKAALDALKSSALSAYQTDLSKASSAAQSVLAAEGVKKDAYDNTTTAIIAQLKARLELLRTEGQVANVFGVGLVKTERYIEVETALNNITRALKNLENAQDLYDTAVSEGAASSGKAKTEIEKLDEAFQKYLKTVENQIKLLSYQEGTEEQQIDLMRQVQEKLHEQAELYRSKGISDNSEYIQELQIQWHEYEKDIADIYANLAKKQEEANKQAFDSLKKSVDQYKSTLQKQIDLLEEQKQSEIDAYQAKIDAIKEAHDAREKENRLLELQNKLLEKQQELANATKEKTVKGYTMGMGG